MIINGVSMPTSAEVFNAWLDLIYFTEQE